jgi:hypothetical protein
MTSDNKVCQRVSVTVNVQFRQPWHLIETVEPEVALVDV